MPSFSRPHVSDDNAFAESVMRTIKYTPAYPEQPFDGLAEAEAWVANFVTWYNEKHLHSGIKFMTPSQRHHGQDVGILAHRNDVYAAARQRHPRRWTGKTRNWTHPATVILNPSPASKKRAANGN